MEQFDVFVVGGGPAGSTLAGKLADAGKRVGITEARGYGGTCALRGCDPKRIMASVAEVYDESCRLRGKGLDGELTMNWNGIRDFVAGYVDPLAKEAADSLREKGISVYHEHAAFVKERTLELSDGTQVRAEHIVLATGLQPADLDIEGAEYTKTSADFHRLDARPDRVLFVGGGYIGLESAHVMKHCGAEVIILNRDDDPLPMFEPELSERLYACTRDRGIEMVMNTEVERIERLDDGHYKVYACSKDGKRSSYEVDLVMNTSGRVPRLEGLQLERGGIESSKEGIPVDDYFRVKGADGVWAIGDVAVTKAPPLTPVANLHARALFASLCGEDLQKADYEGLPTAIYAFPELACVGLLESEAREQGLFVEVTCKLDLDDKYNAYRTQAQAYASKVVVDAQRGCIIGANILGPSASEVINLFALAVRCKLTIEQLRDVPYAYPTWASDLPKMLPAREAVPA